MTINRILSKSRPVLLSTLKPGNLFTFSPSAAAAIAPHCTKDDSFESLQTDTFVKMKGAPSGMSTVGAMNLRDGGKYGLGEGDCLVLHVVEFSYSF